MGAVKDLINHLPLPFPMPAVCCHPKPWQDCTPVSLEPEAKINAVILKLPLVVVLYCNWKILTYQPIPRIMFHYSEYSLAQCTWHINFNYQSRHGFAIKHDLSMVCVKYLFWELRIIWATKFNIQMWPKRQDWEKAIYASWGLLREPTQTWAFDT